MDFVKGAGTALFGEAEPDQERSAKLENHVRMLGIPVEQLKIDVVDETAKISGKAASLADREKVKLVVGNTAGISKVEDNMTVAPPAKKAPAEAPPEPETEADFYTVKAGDTLSKIAKEHYGDPMKYPAIFEANKPMLEDPDKIYPGQVLRIPKV
jgi:nucleoid-associated protein YgaU